MVLWDEGGLQYTVAVLARAYTRSLNMNHLWGMRQNEPLFCVSFWTTGGGRVGGKVMRVCALAFVIVV